MKRVLSIVVFACVATCGLSAMDNKRVVKPFKQPSEKQSLKISVGEAFRDMRSDNTLFGYVTNPTFRKARIVQKLCVVSGEQGLATILNKAIARYKKAEEVIMRNPDSNVKRTLF